MREVNEMDCTQDKEEETWMLKPRNAFNSLEAKQPKNVGVKTRSQIKVHSP